MPSAPAPMPSIIGDAVRWGTANLTAGVGAVAAIEARALMLDSIGFDDYAELLAKSANPLPAAAAARYQSHLRARLSGRPIAYILGWREFYGRRYRTTPAALIPRPETELLVDAALAHLPSAVPRSVLDLGTGCGAIGISIALARPDVRVLATDVGEATLTLANENATEHKAANLRVRHGDWYGAVADEAAAAPFDLIVSNPPYIAADDAHLQQGDLRFEPALALCGGRDGFAALKRVIGEAPSCLRRGGLLLVEHGERQAAAVRALFIAAGFCGMLSLNDLAGIARAMLAVRP